MVAALEVKAKAGCGAWRRYPRWYGKAGGPVLQPRARLSCPAGHWCFGRRRADPMSR